MFTAIGYMCARRLEKKNLERKSEKVREETETQYSSGSLQLEMKSWKKRKEKKPIRSVTK